MMGSTNKLSVPQSNATMASFFSENNQSFYKQLDNKEIDTIINDHSDSEHKTDHELHNLLQKKKRLAALNKKIQQTELEMLSNSSYENPIKQNFPRYVVETSNYNIE